MTIQLKHANAEKLLKELEEMDIIKVINPIATKTVTAKPSELGGSISKEMARALITHIDRTRQEWEGRFPSK